MTEIDLRSEAGRRRPHLIVRRDLRASLLYAISALAVRTLPESRWQQALGWLDATVDRGHSRQAADFRRFVAGYRAMFGADIPEPELRALAKISGDRARQRYLYLAATRRRAGWHPEILLTGREHLDAALARGRGAIVWFDRFSAISLVSKRALFEAGYRMWFLSNFAHGLSHSHTVYSDRVLNWRLIESERRYMAGRLVFSRQSTVKATRRIVEILGENGIAGIRNNTVIGKTIAVPFAGGLHIRLARTPLSIAASRGAALLPVATLEIEPMRRFEVRIGESIRAPDVADPVRAMAEQYVRYVLPLAKLERERWPWGDLVPPQEVP